MQFSNRDRRSSGELEYNRRWLQFNRRKIRGAAAWALVMAEVQARMQYRNMEAATDEERTRTGSKVKHDMRTEVSDLNRKCSRLAEIDQSVGEEMSLTIVLQPLSCVSTQGKT